MEPYIRGAEIDRTWGVATDARDAIWLTYWLNGGYAAPSPIFVITKLAPDDVPSNGVARGSRKLPLRRP